MPAGKVFRELADHHMVLFRLDFMLALSMPPGLKGLRDRALLLLGFAGAFRRSELISLALETAAGMGRGRPALRKPKAASAAVKAGLSHERKQHRNFPLRWSLIKSRFSR
jgi:hypothetical protein